MVYFTYETFVFQKINDNEIPYPRKNKDLMYWVFVFCLYKRVGLFNLHMLNLKRGEGMAIFEVLEDAVVCLEIVFVNGDVPYEKEYISNVEALAKCLSHDYLSERAKIKNADKAFVQNVYFKGQQTDGLWRSEFRLGSQSESDLEVVTMRGDGEK